MSLPWLTRAARLKTLLAVVPGGVRKLTDSASLLKSPLAAAMISISMGGFGLGLIHSTNTTGGTPAPRAGGGEPSKKLAISLRTAAMLDMGCRKALSWTMSVLAAPN